MSSSDTLKNVYIFVGQETFLIEEELTKFRSLMGENASMNSASYTSEEVTNIESLIDLCNTMPFLSDKRLIILRNINKLSQKNIGLLLKYMNNPSDATTLILTIESQKTLKSTLKQLPKTVEIISFDPLKGKNLVDWILNRVKQYKISIDRDAAFLLSDLTGGNTWFIASELEKLSLYAGHSQTITIKDVETLVMRSHESSIFQFMDAFFDKKKDALLRLHELENSGISELEIISRLENQTIIHYQVLFNPGGKKTDIHPFVEKKIISRKTLWKAPQLTSLLADIRLIEHHIKTGRSHQSFVSISEIIGRLIIESHSKRKVI